MQHAFLEQVVICAIRQQEKRNQATAVCAVGHAILQINVAGWMVCFLLMIFVPVQKLCASINIYKYIYIFIYL